MKADVVKDTIRHLRKELPYAVGVSKQYDAEVDDECLAVVRLGTAQVVAAREVDHAAICVIVYASRPDRAEIMAGEVSEAMGRLTDEPRFYACEEYSAFANIDSAGKPTFRLNYRITYV